MSTTMKTPVRDRNEGPSFDVVVERVIGTVLLDGGADHPYAVAMNIIGKEHAAGVYRFPHEDGGMVTVTVEFPE